MTREEYLSRLNALTLKEFRAQTLEAIIAAGADGWTKGRLIRGDCACLIGRAVLTIVDDKEEAYKDLNGPSDWHNEDPSPLEDTSRKLGFRSYAEAFLFNDQHKNFQSFLAGLISTFASFDGPWTSELDKQQ